MKNGVKRLTGVVCLLFVLSGCRTSSPTFTYTPAMQTVRDKALAGDVESMRKMATYHWPESSPHMSHEETCRWLQCASDAGDAMSAELLGWCYLVGDGVPQSRENAARQFYLAGCAYWDRWLLYYGYSDEVRAIYLVRRESSVPCYSLSYSENMILAIGSLNRACLLGSEVALLKKQLIYNQLLPVLKTVNKSRTVTVTDAESAREEIGQFALPESVMCEADTLGLYGKESCRAAPKGTLSGLVNSFLPDLDPDCRTNVCAAMTLAKSVAGFRSHDCGVFPYPIPRSISFDGLNADQGGGLEVAYGWRNISASYCNEDEQLLKVLYDNLAKNDERIGVVLYLAKFLRCNSSTMSSDRLNSLCESFIKEANMTGDECRLLRTFVKQDEDE